MNHSIYLARIFAAYVGLTLLYSALTSHLFSLQILQHDEFIPKYERITRKIWTWSGNRGTIHDRKGNLLAGNLPCKTILADLTRVPTDADARLELIHTLSEKLDVDPTLLTRRFNSDRAEIVVKKSVPLHSATEVEQLDLPGIRFVDQQQRYYPKAEMASNLLGFTNIDNKGQFGLEKIWDAQLRPKKVTRVVQRAVSGSMVAGDSLKPPQSIDGSDLFLTIEEPIQHIVAEELKYLIDEFQPKSAYAIMADPRTGALLALAQYPTFNPNDRRNMVADDWNNHFISDVFDPGSTMKCVAIAGALDFNMVSLDTTIDCEDGFWYYGGRPLRDSGHKFGNLTVAEIVQKSSNIGTAKIGLLMGRNRLYQTLRRFGFGQRTEIGLANESPGILRTIPNWDGLSITRFPIGQGVSVTAMQMIQAYCGIANDGKIMQLQLVDRVKNSATGELQRLQPVFKHFAIRKATAEKIVSAMTMVTQEGGTAENAAVDGFTVAGKTGTSQKLINGTYEGHGKYVASFIGFVPADDPALVLMVVADEPQGSYYGGTVAAPTFSRIADQTLRYMGVAPNEIVQN